MPDEDILKQFTEFLEAKKDQEKADAANQDFEVEIWDEKGRGVRTTRSHARPFLQSLGIDLDPEPGEESNSGDDTGDKSKISGKPPVGKQSQNSTATSVARKYFTQPKK